MDFLHTIVTALRSQTFDVGDVGIVLLLVVLEGVLSIDNALVLGLLARRLPPEQRRKALTYGLIGAFVFRVIAIFLAAWLLRTRFVKLLGGLYLIYLAAKHVLSPARKKERRSVTKSDAGRLLLNPTAPDDADEGGSDALPSHAKFWPTVAAIEFTDIAFAVDSILAAIALVSEYAVGSTPATHPKLWVVVTGGMLGVILIRIAAAVFIKMIDRFPRFESAAYLLVLIIGAKLIVEWLFNVPGQPARIEFQSPSHPPFWIFWGLMAASFCVGFIPQRSAKAQVTRGQ